MRFIFHFLTTAPPSRERIARKCGDLERTAQWWRIHGARAFVSDPLPRSPTCRLFSGSKFHTCVSLFTRGCAGGYKPQRRKKDDDSRFCKETWTPLVLQANRTRKRQAHSVCRVASSSDQPQRFQILATCTMVHPHCTKSHHGNSIVLATKSKS